MQTLHFFYFSKHTIQNVIKKQFNKEEEEREREEDMLNTYSKIFLSLLNLCTTYHRRLHKKKINSFSRFIAIIKSK